MQIKLWKIENDFIHIACKSTKRDRKRPLHPRLRDYFSCLWEVFQMKRQGQISVNSKNMFPIIKKWLYSDKDIFLREIVSNGCDAIKKLESLRGIGQAPDEEGYQPKVIVTIDPDKKQLIVSDNGIGMTEDEVERYITQIAFSGAEEFLAKYKEKSEGDAGIIGHFGLGFYSAFMVSGTVDSHIYGAYIAVDVLNL